MSPTRRICVDLTPQAAEAYERLPGRDRTDAVCRALRLADAVENSIIDGKLALVRPDGATIEIHVL